MRKYRLGLCTWNVGGAPQSIAHGTSSLLHIAKNCDVIVVGLQEVSVGRRGWKAELRKALGSDWAYIGGESYVGLRVKVFARLSKEKPPVPVLHLAALSAQDAAKVGLSVKAGKFPVVGINGSGKRVGVGVADRWPNKGAVAVEIKFGTACRVVFIVAHLAANEDQVQEREDDWRAILRRLDKDDSPLTRGAEPVISVPLFHRYEHVFVLGDLNYRIAPPGTDHKERFNWVSDLVRRKDWDMLVNADQLTRERSMDKVFANFQEGNIAFAPTFKVNPGTGEYSDVRIPSYCDRILWHSLPARMDLVKCVRYTSLPNFNVSDHIPVYAEFQLDVPALYIASPRKPLNPMRGMRIVLEFMLVRFVKGATKFSKREAFDDGPPSLRHIKEPAALKLPPRRVLDDQSARAAVLADFLDDDDQEDLIGDEDEEDEMEEEDEEDSSSLSSDEEYFDVDLNDTNRGEQILYNTGDRREWFQDMVAQFDHGMPRVVGSPSDFSPNLNQFEGSFQNPSHRCAQRISVASTTPKHSSNSLESGNSSASAIHTPPSVNRDSPRPTAHANSGPWKRDSLSRQVEDNNKNKTKKSNPRRRLNKMRMEVHGEGLFLKQGRVYRVGIPKRVNGMRERIGESLPVIPFAPIVSLGDLHYRHVLIEFAKKNSRVGTSGALPLRELLRYVGRPYAFELSLTKYGLPVGILEACVQLTVSDSLYWADAKGRVVRNSDGSSGRHYRGPLAVRKRTRAKSKPQSGKRMS